MEVFVLFFRSKLEMFRRNVQHFISPAMCDLRFRIDSSLRTVQFTAGNKTATVPFEWIVDHDIQLLDANDQRKHIVCPTSMSTLKVESLMPEKDEVVVKWLGSGSCGQPTSSPFAIPVPPTLETSRLKQQAIADLLGGTSVKLIQGPTSPPPFENSGASLTRAWDASIASGAPVNRPPQETTVDNVAHADGTIRDDKRAAMMTTIETFGFAVVEGVAFKGLVSTAKDLEDMSSPTESEAITTYDGFISRLNDATVEVRSACVRKFMESAFGYLRNSHYGLFSVWASDPNWSSARIPEIEASISFNHTKGSATSRDLHHGVPKVLHDTNTLQKNANVTKEVHQDGAYSGSHLDLHTDCTYFRECPKLQGFGCCFSHPTDTQGGETVLADGFMVAIKLAKEAAGDSRKRELISILCTTPVCGRYLKEGRHYTSLRPVIELARGVSVDSFVAAASSTSPNEVSRMIAQISYNNSDRAPLSPSHCVNYFSEGGLPSSDRMLTFYHAYSWFHAAVHDVENAISFKLAPGQLLLFDNFRVLHARLGVSGPRVMCGAYISLDEYYSALNNALSTP